MLYLAAGFLGVILGAAAAIAAAIVLLQRAVDRDLVERRLRALLEYREALGAPSWWTRGPSSVDPAELDQLDRNLRAATREFGLTSWMFEERERSALARSFAALDEEVGRARGRGEHPSSVKIADAHRQLDLALRHAAARNLREFRRWRFLPLSRKAADDQGAAADAWPETITDVDLHTR
jgi:hypothetical protein